MSLIFMQDNSGDADFIPMEPCQVQPECKQEPEASENNNFGYITECQAQLLV